MVPKCSWDFDSTVCLVEIDAGETVRSVIPRLTPEQKRILIYDILCALKYLHQNNVIHRDIKTLNIVVGADGKPKLEGFREAGASEASAASRNPDFREAGPAFSSQKTTKCRNIRRIL
jgi:serine/threonine protein kinase